MANKGINKVILIGNLGQDPELRYMTNGSAVTNITLATSESWRDKQTGEIREQTEWHRIVIFGKLAEIASEYLRKGSQVYIEGHLRTRKWTDQSGNDKYTTEVIVNINGTMQMLGNRQENTNNNKNNNQKQESWILPREENQLKNNIQSFRSSQKSSTIAPNESSIEDFDDDIPF